MPELIDWFGHPVPVEQPKAPTSPNPCVDLYGKGHDGVTCAECTHLFGIAMARTYYKCDLRKNNHGASSDHKRAWPACTKFVQRDEGETRLYDGRH